MSEPLHQPRRPGWDCEDCGGDWPCDPARERLMAETGGHAYLAIMMAAHLTDFCGDQPEGAPGEAFERFVAWTRRTPLDAVVAGGVR